jgi:hypothetical protein
MHPAAVWTKNKLLILEKYFANVDGEIWSQQQGSLKKLSRCKRHRCAISVKGTKRSFYVHRIIASTFLVRGADQVEVDHIDRRLENCALVNLRWVTKTENAANKCATKAKALCKRIRELKSKPVQQLCNNVVLHEYPSATAAGKSLGISREGIRDAVLGRRKTAGGFEWRMSPREMTLEMFKARGFEVVGGIQEAPHVYFSSDLKVYDDDTLGKIYEPPTNVRYPVITIGGRKRYIHRVVAAIRTGYKSMEDFDAHMAKNGLVVMHDGDADKSNWWNCKLGTRSENATDAFSNGCFTSAKNAPRPVVVHIGDDMFEYASCSDAARALQKHNSIISRSARKASSFSLTNGQKACAFFLL